MLIFKNKFLFIAILLLFLSLRLIAQETLAVGQVLDAVEKTPIAHVNIWFKNTGIGLKSSDDGFFMLRTQGQETTLVFSCVGYRTRELKLKPGQSVGLQIELQPLNTELPELFVLPGSNPALDLMKRVRAARNRNNVRANEAYKAEMMEQNLALLAKVNQRSVHQRIFENLSSASLLTADSSLTLPLFMSEQKFSISEKSKKQTSKQIFNSEAQSERVLEQLTGNFTADVNVYQAVISLFDREFVSPLAEAGISFYNYYLIDSLQTANGKEYKLHFRSKNTKNLAFNGSMLIDSGTMAVKFIDMELPRAANLNFVKNLHLKQCYRLQNNEFWVPDSGNIAATMTYNLMADSTQGRALLFLRNSFRVENTLFQPSTLNFAGSNYETAELNDKLRLLNQTPVMKTARWLADVLLTGYMQVGKVDVGKIQNLARITDVEGFRLTAPIRTNEKLWKDFCLGGYLGYGFGNKKMSFSGFAQAKLPFGTRNIAGISYTDDFRRIDYDYTDNLLRENPLVSGDEDIVNTVFALRSSDKVGRRNEWQATLTSDINDDIEAGFSYRSNRIFASLALPFQGDAMYLQLQQKLLTYNMRFSFGERVYNDHLQRIYATNYQPVIYSSISAGKYAFGSHSGSYAKLSGAIKQTLKFGIGQWHYAAEVGAIIGKVPFLMLEIPAGSETDGYKRYQFTCMNYMEYAADKYLSMHHELNLNGIVWNNIPLLKHLNLREMISFKMFYGTLSNNHLEIMQLPASIHAMQKPYMEIGAGVSNILRLFTLQYVWRLTDLNYPNTPKGGLRVSIRVSF
jgi:hypothetical protein